MQYGLIPYVNTAYVDFYEFSTLKNKVIHIKYKNSRARVIKFKCRVKVKVKYRRRLNVYL